VFQYVYRFPALSKINKVQKSQLWNHRDDLHFNEATEVLWGQKNTMEKYIASLNFFQKMKKDVYEKEIQVIESLLKEM